MVVEYRLAEDFRRDQSALKIDLYIEEHLERSWTA